MGDSVWRRFWARAPRQLRFTRAGKVLVAIAFAAGLAAMNTGNNLLFFGWGMVLSAIVVSGVLSEASLRVLHGHVLFPQHVRVGEPAHLPLSIGNGSHHMPAFAVEIDCELRGPAGADVAPAPYQLRLAPRSRTALFGHFVPQRRGRYHVQGLVARTAYPFGFFEKSRRLPQAHAMQFWCLPAHVEVGALQRAVTASMGEAPQPRAGHGDDFFSLRPYRSGDDVRRVAWRRSARAGRWVVIESEALAGREVILEWRPGGGAEAAHEHAISVWASLAEALLQAGLRVGVRGPGTLVLPAAGERQAWEVLVALARLDVALPVPPASFARHTARLALVGPGAQDPADPQAQVVRYAAAAPPAAAPGRGAA